MRYVVGYTDNPPGNDALALGERLARQSGASLDIVLVVLTQQGEFFPQDAEFDQFVDEQASRWLKNADAALDPAVKRTAHLVRADSAARALLKATEPDAGLLVVGGFRTGIGTLMHGSVSSELLHSAKVPVAVAPVGTQEQLRTTPISRITCFLGTRAGAENMIDVAIDTARRAGYPLRIVSLVTVDEHAGELTGSTAIAHAQEVIDKAAARAREALPGQLVTTETGTGSSIEDAVRHTAWEPAEIAFIGSSRLARPRRLFLGSVAAKVSRVLPVPLVVVPSTPKKSKKAKAERPAASTTH
jgi:nucleotide-binding universal stress UspA family protein